MLTSLPSPQEAARELLSRRLARKSFAEFSRQALAPQGFAPAAHHRLLLSELEAIARGENDRLLIMMPPGSAKSTYASHLFPAWFMHHKPGSSIIGASHTAELAEDFSGKVQGFIRDNSRTLGFDLATDAKSRWSTTNGSRYLAAGVGGPIAGFRADCLKFGTQVVTSAGVRPIESLATGDWILTHDPGQSRPCFRRVLAVLGRKSNDLWKVGTSSGRVVEATGNHRFWTGRGWVEAQALLVGDVLMRAVFRSGHEDGSRGQEEPRQRDGQLGDPVQGLPHAVACGGTFEAEADQVDLVEPIREAADVCDIQVAGTECFFANGILVHNCAIIDDPVKNRENADSEAFRNRTWNWFKADLRTRMRPHTPILVIATRWHEDDLMGRIIQDQGSRWRQLKLPAVAMDNDPMGREPGEMLWGDDAYGYADEVQRVREESGEDRDWWSLYQQEPRPLSGGLFKIDSITVADAEPKGRCIRAWDLASTAKTGTRDPDWTVGLKLVRTADNGFCIADVVRVRGGPEEVERIIAATATRDGKTVPISIPQDPGQAGKSQVAYLGKKLLGYRMDSSPETGSKATRAQPVASQCNIGNVSMVRAPWNRLLLDELAAFPSGNKDDQVDALSRAFAGLVGGSYDSSMKWVG